MESIAIAKAFARQNGYEVQPSQELIAIGFGNIVSGFFSSYPVTGSFSRTAVNSASGVASPASGLVTGAVVLLALQFATKVMEYIPAAALASIIIVSVIKMFNYQIVIKMLKVNPIVRTTCTRTHTRAHARTLPFTIGFFRKVRGTCPVCVCVCLSLSLSCHAVCLDSSVCTDGSTVI